MTDHISRLRENVAVTNQITLKEPGLQRVSKASESGRAALAALVPDSLFDTEPANLSTVLDRHADSGESA